MNFNLEGILEIVINAAEFPKKRNSFKPYFVFTLGIKQVKSQISIGPKPEWKEKIVMQYTSESILFFKLYEKSTFLKDKIIADDHLELTSLKSTYKQENFCYAIYKNKNRGQFKIFLTLFPYKLTPHDIFSDCIEEKLIVSNKTANEDVYEGKIKSSNRKIIISFFEFSNSKELNNYKRNIQKVFRISHEDICKIVKIEEKVTERTINLVICYEKFEGVSLYQEIKRRKKLNSPWPESELLAKFLSVIDLLNEFHKNGLHHGDINPLSIEIYPKIKLTNLGTSIKPLSHYIFDLSLESPELKVPYLSPSIMTNYFAMPKLEKIQNLEKCDIFSLGLVFYHMASLSAPLGLNDSQNTLALRIKNAISGLNYSRNIKSLIFHMLDLDENQRYNKEYMAELTEVESNILRYNRVAMEYLKLENFQEAFLLLKKSENIIKVEKPEKIPNRYKMMSITFTNLGVYYKKAKKLLMSLGYMTKALEAEIECDIDNLNIANSHLNLTVILSALSKHEDSLKQAQKAINLLEPVKKIRPDSPNIMGSLIIAYYYSGIELECLGRYHEANINYDNALKHALKKGAKNQMIPVIKNAIDKLKKKIEVMRDGISFALDYSPVKKLKEYKKQKFPAITASVQPGKISRFSMTPGRAETRYSPREKTRSLFLKSTL